MKVTMETNNCYTEFENYIKLASLLESWKYFVMNIVIVKGLVPAKLCRFKFMEFENIITCLKFPGGEFNSLQS